MKYTKGTPKRIEKKIRGSNKFIISFSAFYIFFSYVQFVSRVANVNAIFLLVTGVWLFFLYILKFRHLKIRLFDLTWPFYLFLLLLNVLTTPFAAEGRVYFLFSFVMMLLLYYLRNTVGWDEQFVRLTYMFSGVHVIFILLQAVFPDAIMLINRVLLNPSTYEVVSRSLNQNYHTGITNQAASAGLFATVFLGLIFCRYLTTETRRRGLFFGLLIAFVALFLTQKRSFFILSVIAMYFILLIYNDQKLSKRIFRFVGYGLLVSTSSSIILLVFPQTQNVLLRFFDGRSLFSSREAMYEQMLNWYDNNKLLGVGIGAAENSFGFGGHNIYIQMLAEMGLIGFIAFFSALLGTIILNISVSKHYIKNNPTDKKTHHSLLFSIFMQSVFVMYGVSGNPIYDYTYFTLLIIFLALPVAIVKRKKLESSFGEITS